MSPHNANKAHVADFVFTQPPEPLLVPGPDSPSPIYRWGQLLQGSVMSPALETFDRNTGLLLVAASQAFFSLMNVAVKILDSVDPPMPTLQVCTLPPPV
jgi:hypothetical protein